jgi:DNA-binding transcriptional LysR family regulator
MGTKNNVRTEKDPFDVLDLKSLRCFFSMAKHGSLTKASIDLGISEPAVSQRVRALEEDLGTKLYEARGGRVRLTPAGEQAMSFAISVFDDIKGFEQTLNQGAETGEIVLSALDAILGHVLPGTVESFQRAHPHARLRLLARSIEETIRLLKTNEADVGVIPHRSLPKEFLFRPIAIYRACFITPKGHPLARRAQLDFMSLLNEETMARYPLIVAEEQLGGGVLTETFARLKLRLNIGLEVGSLYTLKRYVARGLGVAVTSELSLTDEDRLHLDIVTVPLELKADTTLGVVLRRDKHRGALLKDLLEMLSEIAGHPRSTGKGIGAPI